MRIVHLSDLHLGFRAYEATDRGWNLRERDLANAFRRALQEIVRIDPDLIVVSGDVFDRPDPPSTALLAATRGLTMVRRQLPRVPVLVIAGERDSPGSPADPGPIAILDTLPGVEAAAAAPRAVRFRRNGVHALLVPYRSTVEPPFPELRPDPDARWNVLVIRGRPDATGPIAVEAGAWDYVAIGGSHVARAWAPNVRAAGALERPGWDPWAATLEERGFGLFDLDRGEWEFHPVAGRAVVDLAPVRVSPGDREAGTRRFRELLQGVPGGIEGKLIRVPLRGDVSSPGDGVARGLLDAVRGRAAHLEIELRGAARDGSESSSSNPTTRADDATSEPWRPRAVSFRAEAGGVDGSVSLTKGGLVLVTSGSEATRARLAAELGAPLGAEALEARNQPFARLEPPPPDELREGRLWSGHRNPRTLLDSLLTGAVEVTESGAISRAEAAADPEETSSSSIEDPARSESAQWPRDPDSLERVLRDLRADSIEASGDLEARTLQWARERQDADSNLQAYRTRARELQSRIRELESEGPDAPCPTCGRPVGDDLDRLLATLKGELESVVQDGRWWGSRREQLDGKPEEIRALEARALELHARVEEAAERAQRARNGGEVGSAGAIELPREGDRREGTRGDGVPDGPRVRDVLREVGTLLGRITQGRLEGVRVSARGLDVVDRGGVTRMAIGTEAAALRFAVHLALWMDARMHGGGVDGLLLWEFHRTGTDEQALPALELAGALGAEGVPVIVVAPSTVAGRLPELFSEVIELDTDGPGPPALRRQSTGPSALSVREGTPRVRSSEPH